MTDFYDQPKQKKETIKRYDADVQFFQIVKGQVAIFVMKSLRAFNYYASDCYLGNLGEQYKIEKQRQKAHILFISYMLKMMKYFSLILKLSFSLGSQQKDFFAYTNAQGQQISITSDSRQKNQNGFLSKLEEQQIQNSIQKCLQNIQKNDFLIQQMKNNEILLYQKVIIEILFLEIKSISTIKQLNSKQNNSIHKQFNNVEQNKGIRKNIRNIVIQDNANKYSTTIYNKNQSNIEIKNVNIQKLSKQLYTCSDIQYKDVIKEDQKKKCLKSNLIVELIEKKISIIQNQNQNQSKSENIHQPNQLLDLFSTITERSSASIYSICHILIIYYSAKIFSSSHSKQSYQKFLSIYQAFKNQPNFYHHVFTQNVIRTILDSFICSYRSYQDVEAYFLNLAQRIREMPEKHMISAFVSNVSGIFICRSQLIFPKKIQTWKNQHFIEHLAKNLKLRDQRTECYMSLLYFFCLENRWITYQTRKGFLVFIHKSMKYVNSYTKKIILLRLYEHSSKLLYQNENKNNQKKQIDSAQPNYCLFNKNNHQINKQQKYLIRYLKNQSDSKTISQMINLRFEFRKSNFFRWNMPNEMFYNLYRKYLTKYYKNLKCQSQNG